MLNKKNRVKLIGVRFNEEVAKLLFKICYSRGEDVSDFVRRATLKELANLSYLTSAIKKALGLARRNEGGEELERRKSSEEYPS